MFVCAKNTHYDGYIAGWKLFNENRCRTSHGSDDSNAPWHCLCDTNNFQYIPTTKDCDYACATESGLSLQPVFTGRHTLSPWSAYLYVDISNHGKYYICTGKSDTGNEAYAGWELDDYDWHDRCFIKRSDDAWVTTSIEKKCLCLECKISIILECVRA